jgi:hypothetical protein
MAGAALSAAACGQPPIRWLQATAYGQRRCMLFPTQCALQPAMHMQGYGVSAWFLLECYALLYMQPSCTGRAVPHKPWWLFVNPVGSPRLPHGG